MRAVILVVVVALFQACGASDPGSGRREIRIALSRDAITWLPVHLAQSLGYTDREGLTLAVSDVAGMSRGAEALLGGSVEVAGGNLIMALQLNAEGRAVQSFVMMSSRPNAAIVATAASKIRSVADLKGRRVGVSSAGSATHLLLNYVLVSHGLSPDDVTPVSIGTSAASVAALEHDRVDAASIVGAAITTMENRHPGLVVLADLRTPEGAQAVFGSPTFPSSSLLAEASWLEANADTVQRFVRAIKKAMTWIREHPADEILAQMPEAIRMADPDADVESIQFLKRATSEDGVVPPDGAEIARRVLAASNEKVRSAALDVSAVYTNAFASAR